MAAIPAQRAVGSLEAHVRAVDDPLDAGRRTVDVGEAFHEEGRATPPFRGRRRANDPRHRGELRRDELRIAAVGHENVERLHHSRTYSGRCKLVAAGDRRSSSGEVLQLRLAEIQLRSQAHEARHYDQADGRDRYRTPQHETRPTAPGALFGMAAVDKPPRHDAKAVDARAENGEERWEQGQRGEHGDGRDQHPADTHAAKQRQRQPTTIASRPTATVVPETIKRMAGMRHRLDERRFDVVAFAELVSEAEDHQQGVVDRDSQPDQRDQELNDDRDAGDEGERPDEGERVEDRRNRDDQWHEDCGQCPEDEEEDHKRAEPADDRLEQDARTTVLGVIVRLVERVAARYVDSGPGRKAVGRNRAHPDRAALLARYRLPPDWIHLLKGRVTIARHIQGACGGEVRARQRAWIRLRHAPHRSTNRRALGDIALRRGVQRRSAYARRPRTPRAPFSPVS